MNDIEYFKLSTDTVALSEVMGFHYRVIQSKPIQASLAVHNDGQVVDVLKARFQQVPLLDMTSKTLRVCSDQGGIFVARHNNKLVGFIAYSPMIGSSLALKHRPQEPLAFINFFRIPHRADVETGTNLVEMALTDAREKGHFRIAFSMTKTDDGALYLEQLLQKTALGTDDFGRLRVMGMNAADMSLGIYRRYEGLKGPSFLILAP